MMRALREWSHWDSKVEVVHVVESLPRLRLEGDLGHRVDGGDGARAN
jgi:hypothetical protein